MNDHQHGEKQRHGDNSNDDVEQRNKEITLSTKKKTKDSKSRFEFKLKKKTTKTFHMKLTRKSTTMVTPVTSSTAGFASAIGARVEFCPKNWGELEV